MAKENLSYRDVTNKQNESFAEVVKQPIRCTPEDFPSLYETRKRKKTFPEINKSTPHVFENIHKDNSGNGVCLLPNNGNNSFKQDTCKALTDRLVEAVMQLSKKENLKSNECETVIKNIIVSLLNLNGSNNQQ